MRSPSKQQSCTRAITDFSDERHNTALTELAHCLVPVCACRSHFGMQHLQHSYYTECRRTNGTYYVALFIVGPLRKALDDRIPPLRILARRWNLNDSGIEHLSSLPM